VVKRQIEKSSLFFVHLKQPKGVHNDEEDD